MTILAKVGRYELLEELGRGAMEVVYRAVDPAIGRPVAVKIMRLADVGTGMSHAELVTRFNTEVRATGMLNHPNIVAVYDVGEADGLFYITMELVEGQSLQARMDGRQPFPLPRVLSLMHQACSALEFAHQHDVIHRNIKPANLLLAPDDTLKITDFGAAEITQISAIQTAHVIGTPSHMSPEQVRGQAVDGRSDIFSLGVVLYELVTREKLFSGESVATVIYKIVNEDPIPPLNLDSSIDPGLSAVIMRALAKPASARFQTCREFMYALQNYRDYDNPDTRINAAISVPVTEPASIAVALPLEDARIKTATPAPVTLPAGVAVALPLEARNSAPDSISLLPSMLDPAPARQRGSVWLAFLLLLIIGIAGYRVWPAAIEIWQRSHAATDSAEIPQPPAPPAPAPLPVPETPQSESLPTASAANPAPAIVPSNPAPAPTAAPVSAPATASAPPPTANDAAAKPAEPPFSPVAAQWKERIEQKMVEQGIGDNVTVLSAGNLLTLDGKLGMSAHRNLVRYLRVVPGSVRIIDDIQDTGEPERNGAPRNNSVARHLPGDVPAAAAEGLRTAPRETQ